MNDKGICSEEHSLPAERNIVAFPQHQSPPKVWIAYVGEIIMEIVESGISEHPNVSFI
jgi:hypothetical protein